MYNPTHFNQPDTDTLHELIRQHPFGMLVSHGSGDLDVNHLPFELDLATGESGVLHTHVARKNPLWQALSARDDVLVIFQAGDAYISPQWYPSKHEFHKQVPTWNYIVAHVRGRAIVHDDERYVRGVVARLTRSQEADQPVPWKMTDSPKSYIDSMLTNIVGIEIRISAIEGKSKLSQNKETRDIRGAGEALKARGEQVISSAMLDCAATRE